MSFKLTDEQLMIQSMVREFSRKVVADVRFISNLDRGLPLWYHWPKALNLIGSPLVLPSFSGNPPLPSTPESLALKSPSTDAE